MLRYFPFAGIFDLKMGTSLMEEGDAVVEVDRHYATEIGLKRSLLSEDHAYYYISIAPDELAAWETVAKIIDDLVRKHPENFSVSKTANNWRYVNRILGEEQSFTYGDSSTLPLPPLDWIGRQIQEDLVLLNGAGEVISGQLCFPSGWALNEKIGKQFMEVHAPLPGVTNPMIIAANKLIERLPLNKPVARNNWGFRLGDVLDLSSKHSAFYQRKMSDEIPLLTYSTFGEKIFLRVEHQTLTRLPNSGNVLFTIHTYNSCVAEEASDPDRRSKMLKYLTTVPPSLIAYKQMNLMYPALIGYLSNIS